MLRRRSHAGLLLTSPGLALAAVLALSACAPELSREELLTRARTSLDSGDLKGAELDIKSVLQESPEDPTARRMYGRIYLQRMDASTAVEQFDRSLSARADQSTRLWLAKSLPMAGESARLIEGWEAGLFITIENQPEFQASIARAMLAQADNDGARAAIDRALAAVEEPNDYVDVTAAIVALQLDGDTFGAEDRLKSVVERDGQNAQALSVLGLIATQARDYEAAAGYFQAASEANPYRIGDRLQLVETQIRLGIADEADSNLARLERQLPKNPTVNMLRGQLLFDGGNYQDAVDLFNQILSVNPNQIGALLLSANANLRLGKLPAAQRQLEDYLALRPGDKRMRLQLAQVYALSGQSLKSESMVRSVLELAPEDETALRLLAAALSSQGRHAESAQILSELAELQPDSTETRIALGSQQLVAGDVEGGLAELEKAVEGAPDSAPARERLIEARLAVQDVVGASAEAEAYVESFPEGARAALYLGRVRLQEGNRDSARELFERSLDLEPGNVPAFAGLAALAVLDGDLTAARGLFEKALAANPGDLLTSVNLAVTLEQLQDIPAMERVLTDAVQANPGALEARLPLARLNLSRGDADKAIDLLQPLVESAGDDARLLDTITRAYLGNEQNQSALESADQLISVLPGDAGALALGAQVALVAGEPEVAEERLRRAIELRSDNSELRKLLIDSLVAQRKLDEAATEIDALSPNARRDAQVLLLRGRIFLSQGDSERAQAQFAEAHSVEPSSLTLVALSAAEWSVGRQEQVLARQKAWLEENPDDVLVRSDYASRIILTGDEDNATTEYERLVAAAPENVPALNNLAWLLRNSDNERALTYVQQANELAPDNPQIKDTFAMVELEGGDYGMALRLNQRALDLDEGNLDILLNRAQILARAGRRDEALVLLEQLEADPDFAKQEEAVALRRSL